MSENSALPWAIRPRRYDDWGFIRGSDGSMACIARGDSSETYDAHRSAGTDPCQANATLIVRAVNAHAELVAALEAAPRAAAQGTDPVEYMDWYFKVRGAILAKVRT